jgi:hypothetical protein
MAMDIRTSNVSIYYHILVLLIVILTNIATLFIDVFPLAVAFHLAGRALVQHTAVVAYICWALFKSLHLHRKKRNNIETRTNVIASTISA